MRSKWKRIIVITCIVFIIIGFIYRLKFIIDHPDQPTAQQVVDQLRKQPYEAAKEDEYYHNNPGKALNFVPKEGDTVWLIEVQDENGADWSAYQVVKKTGEVTEL
jgi:hypothetical protein